MVVHPISNPRGPECWDGKVHTFEGNPSDVAELGAWLSRKVRIRFSYKPGYSHYDAQSGRCLFFPGKYTSGVHCMWIEPADKS
jgi:hypothetical protein